MELQVLDMNAVMESLIQMKLEMMETLPTLMAEALHELLNLITYEIILQVNALNEEMELLTPQNNEMISIRMMGMGETVLVMLRFYTLALPQTRVCELSFRSEEMTKLSLEKPEMTEMLKEEMAAQTCD